MRQIETIRQEAHAAGYAAAMQAIREFAGGSTALPFPKGSELPNHP
jgi:hypothetical protein